MSELIKPPRLNPGDTVGLIAPASSFMREKFEKGLELWQDLFKLKFKYRDDIFDVEDYLAGSDERRIEEVNEALGDDEINAIFVVRGGYGCQRVTMGVDWEKLKSNPKIICGFSDVTVFLNQILKTGVVPFHGLMPATTAGSNPNPFEIDTFSKTLFEARRLGKVESEDMLSIFEGEAEGRLMGGNLALVSASIGTPYEPDLKDSILFLEDVNDPPRVIDRYFTHLKSTGILKKVRGIVFGSFHERIMPDNWDRQNALTDYRKTIERCTKDLGLPVIWGFPAGHAEFQPTFPLGLQVSMNSSEKSYVDFLEPGVE